MSVSRIVPSDICHRLREDCRSCWIERLQRKHIFYEICIHVGSEKSGKARLRDCGTVG
jgi:hypothetical protein